ncbi:MAG: invasin domain 3-containing protein [Phycisphaerales bacterium]
MSVVLAAAPAHAVDREIGGVIIQSIETPFEVVGSGVSGVTVTITGISPTTGTYTATTSGTQGIWSKIVPEGTYSVTPSKPPTVFAYLDGSTIQDGQTSHNITVDADHLAENQGIKFLARVVDPSRCTVQATSPIPNDGSTTSTITVTAIDWSGTPKFGIPGSIIKISVDPNANVTITQPAEDIPTLPDGTVTATITATGAGRTLTITARVGSTFITDDATVEVTGSAVDPSHCVVSADPATLAVGETSTITVTALDSNGDPIEGVPVVVSATPGTGNTIVQPSANTDASGQATATITSTKAEAKTISATAGGVSITQTASVTFTHGPVSASQSTVEAGPASVAVDPTGHGDVSTITITAKDAYGNPVPGVPVEVSATPGTGVTIVPPADTDANGQTTATIESDVAETKTISATVDSVAINDTAEVEFTGIPVLDNITKTDSMDPVDPNDEVTYTIQYENSGLGNATNTVIVETLPVAMEYVSCTDGGTYVDATRTITWTIGALAAGADGEVSFTARVGANMPGGGLVTNSNLTIDCAEAEVVQAPDETTIVRDKEGPTITPIVPDPNEVVMISSTVQLRIADDSGVNCTDGTVTIQIGESVIYDGAAAVDANEYDSTGLDQPIRGICRRTGGPTAYVFTFLHNDVPFGFDKELTVVVHATDMADNATDEDYSFETVARLFGANARVNSDTGTLVQDNPATAVDSAGIIWVVWDQTSAAHGTDIYIASLEPDANAFEASESVAATANNERRPAIAVDANDIVYVVWEYQDPNTGWDILISSYDGNTWSAPVAIAQEDPNDPADQTSPSIAVDTERQPNVIYVAWEDTRNGNSDIYLASSGDDGATWEEEQITTNSASQTEPAVSVDEESGGVAVVWTDSRNADPNGTDIYATSNEHSWNEFPLVSGVGDQSSPTGIASADVYSLWVSNGNDVLYASVADPPVTGESIIDDPNKPGDRGMPALVAANIYDEDVLFAAWQDGRDVASGDVGDIYFAEGSGSFGTNVLVNDDAGTARQMKPAIGVDLDGNPYVVWADNRNGNYDIFYAGASAIESPRPVVIVVGPNETTISTTDDPNRLVVVTIPADALPEGIEPEDITVREIPNPPELPATGFGLCYDFGPSGTEFSETVTLRIPLESDAPIAATYNVYRYDLATLAWVLLGTGRGDEDANGRYVEFEVDHFSIYVAGTTPYYDGGGGGGCALAPWSNANPTEFGLPFAAYVFVLGLITLVDSLRRRSGHARHR